VGSLAGAYPAALMSSISPLKVMRSYMKHGRGSNGFRKSLVVLQFTMSVILIAGTALIYRQMSFMQQQSLGLNKEQIIQVHMRNTVSPKYKMLKEELSKLPGVISASAGNFTYGSGISNVAMLPEGANENEITSEAVIMVDEDFLPTYRISLAAGRNFSRDNVTDEKEAFIVNEAAVKHFNWGTPETALGKTIDWGLGKKGKVIGVVKDFNFSSLHESIKPLIIHILPDGFDFISLKVKAGDVSELVSRMEARWKELGMDGPFDYSFFDQDFDQLYRAEQQVQTILGCFSGLAILIACLGLFGLAAFTAEQRTKEIGVRKVLGADVLQVIVLLSTDFLKPVLIAISLAIPIAWIAADKWLTGFAYRTPMSWWIFALAGVMAILIAVLTVSFQSIRAAMANPVKSLRTE
jgi:putative ABC transport system permease protein